MNSVWLIASASALIHSGMNEAERYRAISPYINPAPGQTVTVSPFEIRNFDNKSDPMKIGGYVVFRPKKGQCFIVTRDPTLPDDRICEEKKLKFTGYMLDWDGSFTWKISTGIGDPGYDYKFVTPHRIAKVIKMGDRPPHLFDREFILSCTAYTEAGDRRVVVDVLKEKKWVIRYPKQDIYKKPPHKYDPNDLYFDPVAPTEEQGIGSLGTEVDPRKSAVQNASKKEDTTTYWMSLANGAYTMPASSFSSTDSPSGLNGECLYHYKGAYRDPLSGWIECHNTDAHDVLYFSVPCAHEVLEAK